MKTIKRIVERWNNQSNRIKLHFNELESYPGFYRINVTDIDFNLSSWYTFVSVHDFTEWLKNVIFN